MTSDEIKRYLAQIGSEGGKAAAKKMTKAARVKRARKAVQAREAKRKGSKT